MDSLQINWFPLSIKYQKNASEYFKLKNDISTDLKLGKEVDQQLKEEITENINLYQKN